jgi:CCDC81-like prokaryotic HU domain 1/CCDC81-like prokaryotic HU domain 2/SPOR domain
MDITAFIRELLFSHDCVIIPGFGGFVGNYSPARIDKSTATFYPPVKQISFNRNLNHNDGLLVGRISGTSGVNYGDARNMVDEFVASIRKKLERGEKVTFDNIGSFINNQEGNVQFEPDGTVNYHLDSFGLESFQFSPLEGYDVRKRISRHISKEPVKKASIKKILWRAAIIIPVLAVLAAIPFSKDIFRSKVDATTLNPLVTAEFDENRKAVEESARKVPPAVEAGAVQSTVRSEEPVLPAAEEKPHYCLITGSFKMKQNAYNQAEMLRKEGYDPEILEAPGNFYRVSAMRCNDLNSAIGKANSISEKFPGTWVKRIEGTR